MVSHLLDHRANLRLAVLALVRDRLDCFDERIGDGNLGPDPDGDETRPLTARQGRCVGGSAQRCVGPLAVDLGSVEPRRR